MNKHALLHWDGASVLNWTGVEASASKCIGLASDYDIHYTFLEIKKFELRFQFVSDASPADIRISCMMMSF
jgi:hypothetical protein